MLDEVIMCMCSLWSDILSKVHVSFWATTPCKTEQFHQLIITWYSINSSICNFWISEWVCIQSVLQERMLW